MREWEVGGDMVGLGWTKQPPKKDLLKNPEG